MRGCRVRERWSALVWIDRFGYAVIVCFVVAIVVLAACTSLNRDEPTLPSIPLPSYASTTTEPPPTTALDCGPRVPPSNCPGSQVTLTVNEAVRRSTGLLEASARTTAPHLVAQ